MIQGLLWRLFFFFCLPAGYTHDDEAMRNLRIADCGLLAFIWREIGRQPARLPFFVFLGIVQKKDTDWSLPSSTGQITRVNADALTYNMVGASR